jgi:hypothetical protein
MFLYVLVKSSLLGRLFNLFLINDFFSSGLINVIAFDFPPSLPALPVY